MTSDCANRSASASIATFLQIGKVRPGNVACRDVVVFPERVGVVLPDHLRVGKLRQRHFHDDLNLVLRRPPERVGGDGIKREGRDLA